MFISYVLIMGSFSPKTRRGQGKENRHVPIQLGLLSIKLLPPREHPRAVNGPMAQRSAPSEAQRARRERVLHEVADQGDALVVDRLLGALAFLLFEQCRRGAEGAGSISDGGGWAEGGGLFES